MVQWLRLPVQEVCVRFLVRELRCHTPKHGKKKKKKGKASMPSVLVKETGEFS